MFGDFVPILVLKSPHTKDVCCGYVSSRMACMCARAVCSSMLRFFKDVAGGKYTFVT